jgi:transketolase
MNGIIRTFPKKNTRKLFFKWLVNEAKKDKKIILLTGDLGYSFIEEFKDKFPDRFINCGIAEQNMIGVATGLAIAGFKPYCYSNATFLNFRCLEQIRDAWLQGLDIKVVGTSASGFLGFTHNVQKREIEPLQFLKGNKNYIRL